MVLFNDDSCNRFHETDPNSHPSQDSMACINVVSTEKTLAMEAELMLMMQYIIEWEGLQGHDWELHVNHARLAEGFLQDVPRDARPSFCARLTDYQEESPFLLSHKSIDQLRPQLATDFGLAKTEIDLMSNMDVIGKTFFFLQYGTYLKSGPFEEVLNNLLRSNARLSSVIRDVRSDIRILQALSKQAGLKMNIQLAPSFMTQTSLWSGLYFTVRRPFVTKGQLGGRQWLELGNGGRYDIREVGSVFYGEELSSLTTI